MYKERNPGIDLLRILAAIMVVGSHMLTIGGVNVAAWNNPANRVVVSALQAQFFSAVNIFALISGYVLCQSRFRLGRILRLWLTVWFYSMLFTGLHLLLSGDVPRKEILSALFPVTFKRMWYVSSYFALFFLTPFLNRLLRSLSKRRHLALTLILLTLSSVISTLALDNMPFGINKEGHNVAWLVIMYILGAYLRMHAPARFGRAAVPIWLGGVALSVAGALVIEALGLYARRDLLLAEPSPTMVMIALGMFLWLRDRRLAEGRFSRLVIRIAPLTFGTYALHMQPLLWIWGKGAFARIGTLPAPLLFVAVFAALLALFAALLAVEFLRAQLFKLLRVDERLFLWEKRLARLESGVLDRLSRAL